MRNFTPMLARKGKQEEQEDNLSSFLGGIIGFFSWWIALAIPFLFYGSNTLFFFLYTWPFFLALVPVSMLIGIVVVSTTFLHGQLLWTMVVIPLLVVCLFWLLFMLLSGW